MEKLCRKYVADVAPWPRVNAWRKRYFVLQGPYISYFSCTEPPKRGVAPNWTVLVAELTDVKPMDASVFSFTTPGRVLVLRAPSPADAARWLRILQSQSAQRVLRVLSPRFSGMQSARSTPANSPPPLPPFGLEEWGRGSAQSPRACARDTRDPTAAPPLDQLVTPPTGFYATGNVTGSSHPSTWLRASDLDSPSHLAPGTAAADTPQRLPLSPPPPPQAAPARALPLLHVRLDWSHAAGGDASTCGDVSSSRVERVCEGCGSGACSGCDSSAGGRGGGAGGGALLTWATTMPPGLGALQGGAAAAPATSPAVALPPAPPAAGVAALLPRGVAFAQGHALDASPFRVLTPRLLLGHVANSGSAATGDEAKLEPPSPLPQRRPVSLRRLWPAN